MTDISSSEFRLNSAWRAFGRSTAAGTGALTALLSLIAGVPLATACGRGALALFGVLILTRIVGRALEWLARVEDSDVRSYGAEAAESSEPRS